MTGFTTYLSKLTLNVNRQLLANRIKKEDTTMCSLTEKKHCLRLKD
jgi:hypothetical protein